jgi:hypothetical protein
MLSAYHLRRQRFICQSTGDEITLNNPTHDNDIFHSYLVEGARFRGDMELPSLPLNTDVPSGLTEFRKLKNPECENQFIHFYMPDQDFMCVYRNPQQYLNWFRRFGGIIGFDFSVHAEFPMYKQIESFGRNRELSYWFSQQGISVIPNVRWGTSETFEWCFEGLPKRSTVAVSTLGCSKKKFDKRLFANGFLEMMTRLEPTTVIVYGTKSDKLFPPLFVYKTNMIFFESQYTISHRKEAV